MTSIDHNPCLVLTAMRACVPDYRNLFACIGLSLAGVGAAAAQQTPLNAGALFDSTRQVAADQARQAEAGAAAQVGKSLHSPAVGAQTGLPALQGPPGQHAPFGTGYERRMERAAAMAGLAVGSPARPAAAGAVAGGAGPGGGSHAGGQGSGRGRR
ncbi:MAG: hypothetical protein RBR52_11155 [Thiomonas sp.]|uniref:hypothetical protein n=1 Tax=Thiomonas sp. TaxID=2047785 RepID=UPI002A36527F|nr:hypothetical protein [Thiomonas sp.]MDY0331042.1 hypothetical protein [Thiomonas sp.]